MIWIIIFLPPTIQNSFFDCVVNQKLRKSVRGFSYFWTSGLLKGRAIFDLILEYKAGWAYHRHHVVCLIFSRLMEIILHRFQQLPLVYGSMYKDTGAHACAHVCNWKTWKQGAAPQQHPAKLTQVFCLTPSPPISMLIWRFILVRQWMIIIVMNFT